MNDLHTNPAYIVIDDSTTNKDEMKELEEEQRLFNEWLEKVFGINVNSSTKEQNNGST